MKINAVKAFQNAHKNEEIQESCIALLAHICFEGTTSQRMNENENLIIKGAKKTFLLALFCVILKKGRSIVILLNFPKLLRIESI